MKRARIIITGLVTGVGFRSYTRNYAKEIGLKGYVKNLRDGTIEVVAEGYDKQFQTFLQLLRKGPLGAKVKNIDVDWQEPRNEFEGFEVKV